jgi:uncharacterized protein DUF5681
MSKISEMSEKADYEVGYKKPPRHSQFKAGNRANPLGRGKRKRPTEAEIVHEIMTQSVSFREGDKSQRARRIELLIKSFGSAALKGDVGAAEALLKIRKDFAENRAIEPIVLVLPKSGMKAA